MAGGEAGGEASLGIEDPASLGTFGPAEWVSSMFGISG